MEAHNTRSHGAEPQTRQELVESSLPDRSALEPHTAFHRVNWLIHADSFDRKSVSDLRQAIKYHTGVYGDIVQSRSLLQGVVPSVNYRQLHKDDCVILWGSPPLMKHVQIHYPEWTPGGWCNFENLECSTYYPRLGDALLNATGTQLTVGQAKDQVDRLFSDHGRNGEVFLRPSSLEKVFPSGCVNTETYLRRLESCYRGNGTEVVVATPRSIVNEWRLVFHRHEAIAASLYREGAHISVSEGAPVEVIEYAESVFKDRNWIPDNLFVADVGLLANGEYKIIELNSFSCSGFYACDMQNIVQHAVSEARTLIELSK